jgi:hypothetical protein
MATDRLKVILPSSWIDKIKIRHLDVLVVMYLVVCAVKRTAKARVTRKR